MSGMSAVSLSPVQVSLIVGLAATAAGECRALGMPDSAALYDELVRAVSEGRDAA
jgi:hypothetical protein